MNWTGFYVGAQVGYGFGETSHSYSNGAPSGKSKPDGIIGGLHAGYNYQFGSLVLGVEADINASGGNGSFINNTGATSSGSSRYDWAGSVRLRGGVAFDRILLFVTGGVAYADWRYRGGPGNAVPASILCCGYNSTRTGWTGGAGIEYAITNNWTARAEYRYTDYGNANGALVPTFPAVNMRVSSHAHAVTLGISYLFSSAPAAVVAKY